MRTRLAMLALASAVVITSCKKEETAAEETPTTIKNGFVIGV